MKPLKFEGSTELKKPDSMTDEECSSLWIYQQNNECISLWTAPLIERLKFLLHGHVWIGVVSGKTQPPIWLDCRDDIFEIPKKSKGKLKKLYYWILLKIKRLKK